MKKFCSLSKLVLGLSMVGALAGCAQSAKAPVYGVQSDAISDQACQNNAYLKQYGCSLQRVEQAAQSNEPDAEYALGYMYYNGIGTVKDAETAQVWIKRAAEQGQPLAISALKTIRQSQFPNMGQVNIGTAKHAPKKTHSHPVDVHPAKVAAKVVATTNTHKPIDSMGSLKNMPADHFTVQLFASPHLDNVRHLEQTLAHNVPMTIASMQKNGATWYLLLAGNFATRPQATAYVATLPANVKSSGPWIRSFGSLEKQ
jgi:septal ring-binding cell division protein DamX